MTIHKFCNASDVTALGKIGANYAAYDNLLNNYIIPMVTKQIKNYCRRDFAAGSFVEFFGTSDRNEPTKIYLKELNLTAAPSVKYDVGYPVDWSDVDDLSLSEAEYEYDATNGNITLLISTIHHPRSIRVAYSAGFTVDSNGIVDVPDEVVTACAIQSAYILERQVAGEIAQLTKKDGKDQSSRLAADAVMGLLPQVRTLLGDHRRILTGRIGV